ncbi:cilia-and flagella-associated protein 96 isoform X1 [Narcine bancroftii]|uniref:cilia-and flagella-associated protein 96 isoform X1 n=1 Tax=Narcine bancroftii TaxID=1343680 RepID=UPI0038318E7D
MVGGPSRPNATMPGESGKTDMERIGLFQEMPYVTVQDPYLNGMPKPFNESAYKGKQILLEGSKSKCATQAGYFDSEFMRIFENESYSDRIKLRRQERLKAAAKNLGGVFIPSQGDKKPCGLGTYYGTIGGSFKAFSRLARPKPPFVPENKNFYTSPGKKGTGYGFAHLTIGESYGHSPDPYTVKSTKKDTFLGGPFRLNLYPKDHFDNNPYSTDKILPAVKIALPAKKTEPPFKPTSPGKLPGGMKAGTFDVYPDYFSHLARPPKVDPKSHERLIFRPNPGLWSRPIKSVLVANVNRVVNNMNYKNIDRVMAY